VAYGGAEAVAAERQTTRPVAVVLDGRQVFLTEREARHLADQLARALDRLDAARHRAASSLPLMPLPAVDGSLAEGDALLASLRRLLAQPGPVGSVRPGVEPADAADA
jgi:hypothetical protein